MTDLKERILETLYELSDNDMVNVHNEYCIRNNYMDDYIEYMWDFDDSWCNMRPSEIIEKFGEMNMNDKYYVADTYSVAVSFSYYEDAPITYYDEIAEYCAENRDDLYSWEIRHCINEYEDEYEHSKEEAEWNNGGEDSYMEHHYLTEKED